MTDPLVPLLECTGFDWDEGNSEKNWIKQQVSRAECEELFFNEPLVVAPDERHSADEPRYYVLGQTDEGRRVFVVVTIRDKLIRVISARDMRKAKRRSTQVPKPKKVLRMIPKFETEDQERQFWAANDSTEYLHWPQGKRVKLSNLRPTTRVISIRCPETMIERLKILANKRDVPYQSLLKIYVAKKLEEELRAAT